MEPINWHTFLFLLFALVSCTFAVAVVVSRNIVRMALHLILSLGATSGLFFLAGADFVGAMQLMIYVGGTLVLLIFGVMLTAQGPFISMKTSGGDWIMAFVLSGLLLALLVPAAFTVRDWRSPPRPEQGVAAKASPAAPRTSARLGMGLLGARVDKLEPSRAAMRGGMSGYLLPFELISVHLLVVLIGAAYLARAKRHASKRQVFGAETQGIGAETQGIGAETQRIGAETL